MPGRSLVHFTVSVNDRLWVDALDYGSMHCSDLALRFEHSNVPNSIHLVSDWIHPDSPHPESRIRSSRLRKKHLGWPALWDNETGTIDHLEATSRLGYQTCRNRILRTGVRAWAILACVESRNWSCQPGSGRPRGRAHRRGTGRILCRE